MAKIQYVMSDSAVFNLNVTRAASRKIAFNSTETFKKLCDLNQLIMFQKKN